MSTIPFGYSEKLPETIRSVFLWLCQDLTALQSKWDFFLELYGSEEHTALLSQVALASFNIIYDSLLNDMIMGISRLTDPSKSGREPGHDNLTFSTLVEMCDKMHNVDALRARLKELRLICEPIRAQRNRRVGHRDLTTAIEPLNSPLPGVTKPIFEQALRLSTNLLNTIYESYDNGFLDFHGIGPGQAHALIYWLEQAKAFFDHSSDSLKLGGA